MKSGDDSDVLFDRQLGCSFRSVRGAQTESETVFVLGCGITAAHEEWSVFELGFGTGTNFLRTWEVAKALGISLRYKAVERELLSPRWAYGQNVVVAELLEQRQITRDGLTAEIVCGEMSDYQPASEYYNAIYHDPFGPRDQPSAWTAEIFKKYRPMCTTSTTLATYSAATSVRRAMHAARFYVFRGPGLLGKRETTYARLSPQGEDDWQPWK